MALHEYTHAQNMPIH